MTQFAIAGRDGAGNVGQQAESPAVKATLLQEGTSLARYTGTWSTTRSSTASNGTMRTSTRAGASVEFKRDARAIAVVGRQGPTSGKARVYVDGVYIQTIDLYRSTSRSKVVLFSRSWSTPGVHSVKLVIVGNVGPTARRCRCVPGHTLAAPTRAAPGFPAKCSCGAP